MENTVIFPNDSELVTCCHFCLPQAFPQYVLNKQLLYAYSREGAVQYIMSVFSISGPKSLTVMNSLDTEHQRHLPLIFTKLSVHINIMYYVTIFISITFLF